MASNRDEDAPGYVGRFLRDDAAAKRRSRVRVVSDCRHRVHVLAGEPPVPDLSDLDRIDREIAELVAWLKAGGHQVAMEVPAVVPRERGWRYWCHKCGRWSPPVRADRLAAEYRRVVADGSRVIRLPLARS